MASVTTQNQCFSNGQQEERPVWVKSKTKIAANSWGTVQLMSDLVNPYVVFSPDVGHPALRLSPAILTGNQLCMMVANLGLDDVELAEKEIVGWGTPFEEADVENTLPWEVKEGLSVGGGPKVPNVANDLSPSQQQKLRALLEKYCHVFAQKDSEVGRSELVEHSIQVQGPAIRQPFRRQPPGHRAEEQRQVEEMYEQGIISPSRSPWSSPAVLVRKKDGTLRFCVDYRKLNAVTLKDAHPLPRIDDTLEALQGCQYFSTLDLQKGYYQVPVRREDRPKTAFSTSFGELWEFNVLPMGVCNGPATFARMMEQVLHGLQWKTCIAYLDDVIIFAPTFEEHCM